LQTFTGATVLQWSSNLSSRQTFLFIMMKITFAFSLAFVSFLANSQNVMTPELLWKLGRVSPETVSPEGNLIYRVTYYDMDANKGESNLYSIPVNGGTETQLTKTAGTEYNVVSAPNGKMGFLYNGDYWEANWDGTSPRQITKKGDITQWKFSPDARYVMYTKEVKVAYTWQDRYPALSKANAHLADDLMYRHWDTWEDGNYSHIFVASYYDGELTNDRDIMQGEPFDCPLQPHGGAEDFVWSGNGEGVFYACKKHSGKQYAVSTNTGIYYYSIGTGKTQLLTPDLKGYDLQPAVSPKGINLAWLSMAQEGNEADKANLMVGDPFTGKVINLTKDFDETVESFRWSNDGKKLFFISYASGTKQLFETAVPDDLSKTEGKSIRQITRGVFDIDAITGESGSHLLVTKTDMNHAAEIARVDLLSGTVFPVTAVNASVYAGIGLSRIDQVWVTTTDGQKMLTWVIYPPGFDPSKKYPALLYCQGGPQTALSQFYSFRWNFQLMAANGYIIIAPCRRGMPGFGTKWNADISKDHGGQPIRDYLSATDSLSKWSVIDRSRIGCVGASYGGYSAFMLEGVHAGRFKTFISHCGIFNLKGMYNSTEELWFTNWEYDGSWWKSPQPKSYTESDPMNFIDRWITPMMIITGEKDYRIPYTQSLEAFQILQLKGIKSRLLVFPDEGHWVLKPQDALLWQQEFYRWLRETL
jgi:dipeptidyl aminopeptidase/acylaminoacyl peptidase